ncbi:uncharacterized protein DSM5745_09338 [Aspergillus mulundensis]|uniref:RmlD-like substrate binding domain-containing protein n=1 Tax=Aspergillus mulundensis TaxID=1810919 RepID=A0A3D8R091_9EURO|nr:hypothetical protein DSM5745_09338 [Aspergillus mulundensis]RDW67472.1 hypothetical protein DSM5745_09338 [Aspergillus mulundensis]
MTPQPKILIWGKGGWIATHLKQLLERQIPEVEVAETAIRMENREAVLAELDRVKPTHVLNCAGKTGRPNVDWCESNKEAVIRSNVVGALNLTDCCYLRGVHVTHFATGCIYTYDEAHPIGGPGFKETDKPNFAGSFYSRTKGHFEQLASVYPSTLILRLRLPISDDLHPRCLITKITAYERVINIPNSVTVLHDLLPVAVRLALGSETGIYNFTSPGAVSHNEILEMYREIIDPAFRWENFTVEQMRHVVVAERSNCALDVSKLEAKAREFGIEISNAREAVRRSLERSKGL